MKPLLKISLNLLISIFCVIPIQAQKTWNIATSRDSSYNWPMIGNGEIETIIGPNGFHNGKCLEVESVDRAIFWAGRRHRDARTAETWIPRFDKDIPIGSTQPLVRFGRLTRLLLINGIEASDDNWEQTLDFERGIVQSSLNHGTLKELTESMVLLNQNIMVFHTTLTNTSPADIKVDFTLKYEFGDAYGNQAIGTKLFIFRPYPTDKLFGSIDGKFSSDPDVETRAPHVLESLLLKFEVEDHLGEIRIGRYPMGKIQKTMEGGNFIHEINLRKGESKELWFWVCISDRLKYTYFPTLERVKILVNEHYSEWESFWSMSSVNLGNPDLERIYKSCLYTLRCNSGPWSSSCGILASHWEGRFLHDEMFVFFGLISSNHPELARKIPNWRWLTYDEAVHRSKGNGTFYAWEATEEGKESSPIGQWDDERYIHGEISEHIWRYYLYTGDEKSLEQFYPVLKGNVEWLIYDVLKYGNDSIIGLRAVVPPVEHVYPAENCMYTICAFTRALQNAAKAATILGKDSDKVDEWLQLAEKIKKLMPVDKMNNVYKVAENMDDPFGVAHLGSLFPFAVELESDITKNTLSKSVEYFFKSKEERTTDLVFATTTWIWGLSNLASACFVAGEGEKGYNILKEALYTVGSFNNPPEHWNKQDGAYIPWHTTGAGAYIAAVNGMFIQVYDEYGAIIFPAISKELKNVSFNRLLASDGVVVSGKMKNGKIVSIVAQSPAGKDWTCRIPLALAKDVRFNDKIITGRSAEGQYMVIHCMLLEGDNSLIE